jgi:hypothetical protein
VDFAIDVQLAQAARNQLRDLAAKVDDEKAVVGCLCHARAIGQRRGFRKVFSRLRAMIADQFDRPQHGTARGPGFAARSCANLSEIVGNLTEMSLFNARGRKSAALVLRGGIITDATKCLW